MYFGRKKKSSKSSDSSSSDKGQSNFEEKWQILQNGVTQLVNFLDSDMKKPFNHEEYAKLYATVYDLCTTKVDTGSNGTGATELLYDRFAKCINEYLLDRVVPALKQKSKETLLPQAVRRWRDHTVVVKYLGKVFNYLDRYYTKHNNRDSLRDVGLKCYQTHVYGTIKEDMARALLDKVDCERKGEIIDRAAMKDGVNLFIEMGLNSLDAYIHDFEAPLIRETDEFYKLESAKWINEDSCPEYMKKAENRLEQEQNRAEAYLHHSTSKTLIETAEKQLISAHADRLLHMENSGFLALLKDLEEKKDDLSRMYRLFKRVDGLKPMSDMMRDYIKEQGMAVVKMHQEKEELDYKSFINTLLDLHEEYSSLVNDQFQKDALFLEALKDAFTHFINTNLQNKKGTKTTTSELLSTYCDYVMKNTDKFGEEKLEDLLEKIVRLFAFISDKDMFQEYYRRQLSKRLLVSSSTNHDAERSLIAKLKMRCGASFTSKLEGMIKDKNLSEDLQNSFKEYCKSKGELSIDFTPKVLTTGFWPNFKTDQLTIPPELETCVKRFKEFYDSRTESRSLKWAHSLGNCTVQGLYASGNKELHMSTYQACILLLFNDDNFKEGKQAMSAGDIQKALNLPFEDVRKNILSMCVSKQARILVKKDGDSVKNVKREDTFAVNPNFKSKKHRIRIPNLIMKITNEDRRDIDKTMEEDRKHAIEAAIVRIMKARRQMKHQNLILEVSKQLMQHFRPDPKAIKMRISDLLTREYLSRDGVDTYNYVA